MFALKQNYLKRELHAGKKINKRLSFLNHNLVFPCLSCSDSEFRSLVPLTLDSLSMPGVSHRHENWNLAVAVEILTWAAGLMGFPRVLELLLKIREISICGISDFRNFPSLFQASLKCHCSISSMTCFSSWLQYSYFFFFYLVLY